MRTKALKTTGCALLLFAANWYVVRDLFFLEYTRHLESIEGAFIGLARYIAANWTDIAWFPLWDCGIPFLNTYLPLLHATVAATSGIAGISPALAYHAVAAVSYSLGPVTLFWLAWRLSGSRWLSFAAGLVYSVLSPSIFLMPAVRGDIADVFRARRLQALVQYGENPHVTSMTLVPVAIVLLDIALKRRKPGWYLLAAISMAAVVLTNLLGGFALAAAAAAYLLAVTGKGAWRSWTTAAGIGVLAYVLAMPWIPPSTLGVNFTYAQVSGGEFPVRAAHLRFAGFYLAACALLHALFRRYDVRTHLRFFVYFSLFMSSLPLALEWFGVAILPMPARYHLEMEMALIPAAVFAVGAAMERSRRHEKAIVLCGLMLFCYFQLRTYRHYARYLIGGIDIKSTTEYRQADWLKKNLPGRRVLAPGSVSFYLNSFTSQPQVSGGFVQGTANRLISAATYQIFSGDGTGDREGEVAVLWLKAFGAHAVGVGGPNSREHYKPYRNPRKFEGLLPELWREGDDAIYGVPQRSPSLARVVREKDLVSREPLHGGDVDPLRPYVAALEDPSLPLASFNWRSRHEAVIEADLRPEHVLSVQTNYAPGWRASAGGRPCRVFADKLGLLAVAPRCEGRCRIELTYDQGWQMRLARLASGGSVLGCIAWMLLVWKREKAARPS